MTTTDVLILGEQKKDCRNLFSSIPMNKDHKIETFQMIGMTAPVNGTTDQCLNWLRTLHHANKVYPEETYDPEDKRPPNCIFVPDTPILNQMLETCAKHPDDIEYIYSRFTCLDQRKPQWLIDVEAKNELD